MRFWPAWPTLITAIPDDVLEVTPYSVSRDAGGLQEIDKLRAEHVVADAPDHCGAGAHAGCGNGLVGALAAGVGYELITYHRLTIRWEAVGEGHQVHIDAAQGNDQRAGRVVGYGLTTRHNENSRSR